MLPDKCLGRLAQLLHHIEEHGQWPQALLQWKVSVIPKCQADVTPAHRLRPISVDAVVYRGGPCAG
eukprot:4890099-Alexandrium_andersonii.AAC.1